MINRLRAAGFRRLCTPALMLIALSPLTVHAGANFQIYVSNEKSGDVTVINGSDNQVLATIPVGKRPRGIHASPDGKTVYVALSGTPISAPPQLDAKGNPTFIVEIGEQILTDSWRVGEGKSLVRTLTLTGGTSPIDYPTLIEDRSGQPSIMIGVSNVVIEEVERQTPVPRLLPSKPSIITYRWKQP